MKNEKEMISTNQTHLKSSKFRISCVMFMFMSLNVRVSKSFNCDFVIFNQIFSWFWNLFCNESNTWLNESSPSHVTWIVLFRISCGEQEHGDISGLIEQCNEATCTIDTTVYTRDAIIYFCTYSSTLDYLCSVKLSTSNSKSPQLGQLLTRNDAICEIENWMSPELFIFQNELKKKITFSRDKNSVGAFWNSSWDIFTLISFCARKLSNAATRNVGSCSQYLCYSLHSSKKKIVLICRIDFSSQFFWSKTKQKQTNALSAFKTQKKSM